VGRVDLWVRGRECEGDKGGGIEVVERRVENAERFLAGIKVGDNDTKEHGVVWDKVMVRQRKIVIAELFECDRQLWK